MEIFDKSKQLFEKIKSIGFFERLFSWNKITSLIIESYNEFKSAELRLVSLKEEIDELKRENSNFEVEIKNKEESIKDLKNEKKELQLNLDNLNEEKQNLSNKIAAYNESKKKNNEDYEKKVKELNVAIEDLKSQRNKIQKEREEQIKKNFEEMKKTWKKHEIHVENTMKRICKSNIIEYVDKFPHKGNPDNIIKIADEMIIFDAKSPSNDDLDNFPKYLKSQTKRLKKYSKYKNVKNDLFLVIPSNTLEKVQETLPELVFDFSEYKVFIISLDSIEPIILSLKKIEEYEFAEELSPEDRENVCRILGRFAHTTKRRIQIDQWFSSEFIDILSKTQILPEDILERSIELEKRTVLNPKQDRRSKKISEKVVKRNNKQLKFDAESRNINTDKDLNKIREIPLNNEVKKKEK